MKASSIVVILLPCVLGTSAARTTASGTNDLAVLESAFSHMTAEIREKGAEGHEALSTLSESVSMMVTVLAMMQTGDAPNDAAASHRLQGFVYAAFVGEAIRLGRWGQPLNYALAEVAAMPGRIAGRLSSAFRPRLLCCPLRQPQNQPLPVVLREIYDWIAQKMMSHRK